MPDEDFDPWATAVADGTSSALKKASKKKDVWGSFRAGEAEALSDSEAPKPGKQGSGKKKKGDSKKPSGPSGPNLARRRVMDHKISGSVESWSNTYGWIRPFQHVGHPKANKHGGKLYIHAKDLVGGVGFLPTGASVEFYVFEDDAGLGAEECALAEWNGKGGKGWGSKGWDAGKGWGKGMWDMGKGWAKGMWGGFDGWTGGGKKGWDGGKGLSGKGKDSKSSGKGEWGGKERSKGGDGAKGAGAKDGKGKASKGSTQTVAPKEPQPGVSDFDQVHSDWSHYTGLGGLAASATGPSAGSGFAAATGCTGQAPCRQPIASAAGTAPLLGASANMKPMGGKPLQGVPEASWSEVAPPAPYLMNSVGPAPPAMGSMHVNPVPYGSYSMMPGMLNPTVPQQVAMSNPAMGLGPGLYHAHVPPPPPGGPGPYERPVEGVPAGPVGAWPTWTG